MEIFATNTARGTRRNFERFPFRSKGWYGMRLGMEIDWKEFDPNHKQHGIDAVAARRHNAETSGNQGVHVLRRHTRVFIMWKRKEMNSMRATFGTVIVCRGVEIRRWGGNM